MKIQFYNSFTIQLQNMEPINLHYQVFKYCLYFLDGVEILGVTSISIGWITNTYLSTPFLISTTSSSYLF